MVSKLSQINLKLWDEELLDKLMIDELDDVDEVVDDVEVEEVNVVNDDANVNIVSAKVVTITKAKLQAIAKVVDPVDDPVVEIVHEKRRGRPTLAEAALKLDKLQEIEKLKPVVVRRTSNRNSKKLWFYNNFNFLYFELETD